MLLTVCGNGRQLRSISVGIFGGGPAEKGMRLRRSEWREE